MTKRVNPFANVTEMPVFKPKPKPQPSLAQEAMDTIADANNFPSRQARVEPKPRRRKPRLHRTGRNQNFSLKVTAATQDRFYRAADEHQVTLGRLLELALDALEKQTPSGSGTEGSK